MRWRGCGSNCECSNAFSQHSLERLEKTTKNLNQASSSSRQKRYDIKHLLHHRSLTTGSSIFFATATRVRCSERQMPVLLTQNDNTCVSVVWQRQSNKVIEHTVTTRPIRPLLFHKLHFINALHIPYSFLITFHRIYLQQLQTMLYKQPKCDWNNIRWYTQIIFSLTVHSFNQKLILLCNDE